MHHGTRVCDWVLIPPFNSTLRTYKCLFVLSLGVHLLEKGERRTIGKEGGSFGHTIIETHILSDCYDVLLISLVGHGGGGE